MTEYHYTIIIAALFGALSIPCFILACRSKQKNRTFILLIGICFLLFATLPLFGAMKEDTSLIGVGTLLPGGLILTAIPLNTIRRHRRCTMPQTAVFSDFRNAGRYGESRIPVFRYPVEGTMKETPSFVMYPRKKFERLFTKGVTYEIFVNPADPTDCADKRYFPWASQIFLLAIGILVILISLVFFAQILLR